MDDISGDTVVSQMLSIYIYIYIYEIKKMKIQRCIPFSFYYVKFKVVQLGFYFLI